MQFFVIYFILRFREIYLSNLLETNLSFTGRDWKPSYASGCKYLFFVCRYRLHSVAWFSYWFDNFGFITEGNTYLYFAASPFPLQGKNQRKLKK